MCVCIYVCADVFVDVCMCGCMDVCMSGSVHALGPTCKNHAQLQLSVLQQALKKRSFLPKL